MLKLEDNFNSDPEFKYERIKNNNGSFTLKILNALAYDSDIDAVRKCHIIIHNYEPYRYHGLKITKITTIMEEKI